ncbi:MAG TPA: hypothetical protein ENH59_01270 [Bacteroidetes bacterium]|nr:hypothetical protein [Bacteroidota bacterium]
MNTERIKKVSLSIFIVVSLFLILVQLVSNVSTSREPKQAESITPFMEPADNLMIHPDSLWQGSEFTNER